MIKKLILISTLLILSSCNSKQYFSVVVWNKSNIKLKDTLVWDNGKVVYSMGVLPINIFGEWMSLYTPLSKNIKLTWTEYDTGIKREAQVDMRGIIPENYDGGTVQFDILGPNEVKAKFYFAKKYNF